MGEGISVHHGDREDARFVSTLAPQPGAFELYRIISAR